MLNLNQVESGSEQAPLELIPDKTPVRVILNLLGGDTEVPEFGQGHLFKTAASGSIYCPLEFTIIGGQFDKRRVWHNMFVHGPKLDSNGVSVARKIGLETLRRMVDSIHNLKGADMSAEAQQKRNIAGVQALQGQELSILVGVEPAQNGYDARNKMTVVLTPDNSDYVGPSGGAAPVASAPMPTQPMAPAATASAPSAPTATATAGVVPAWAQK